MAFSNTTLIKLAHTITPEVCDEIFKSEEYATFMQEIIPNVINRLFGGKISEELTSELSFIIFDNINIEPFKK